MMSGIIPEISLSPLPITQQQMIIIRLVDCEHHHTSRTRLPTSSRIRTVNIRQMMNQFYLTNIQVGNIGTVCDCHFNTVCLITQFSLLISRVSSNCVVLVCCSLHSSSKWVEWDFKPYEPNSAVNCMPKHLHTCWHLLRGFQSVC